MLNPYHLNKIVHNVKYDIKNIAKCKHDCAQELEIGMGCLIESRTSLLLLRKSQAPVQCCTIIVTSIHSLTVKVCKYPVIRWGKLRFWHIP
jgi:hypothetical protein